MKTRNIVTALATLGIAGAMVAAPVSSFADGWSSHRTQQKDQWKSIGVGAAAVGIFGLLTHNDTLSVLGLGGAAYSGYRYSQDSGGDRYYQGGGTGWGSTYIDNDDRDNRYNRAHVTIRSNRTDRRIETRRHR
jgi:hypothetical protein